MQGLLFSYSCPASQSCFSYYWNFWNYSWTSCCTKPRFCHITPVFPYLHWLPVRNRISFKIATVTFRVLQFLQLSYLSSLIPRYVSARALRSSSSFSICVPPRWTTMATSKSFSSVASNIWNSLPNDLSSIPTLPAFRRALKHHLFLLVYPDSSAKSGKIIPAQYVSHFVIQRQLLPLHRRETPCRRSIWAPTISWSE